MLNFCVYISILYRRTRPRGRGGLVSGTEGLWRKRKDNNNIRRRRRDLLTMEIYVGVERGNAMMNGSWVAARVPGRASTTDGTNAHKRDENPTRRFFPRR